MNTQEAHGERKQHEERCAAVAGRSVPRVAHYPVRDARVDIVRSTLRVVALSFLRTRNVHPRSAGAPTHSSWHILYDTQSSWVTHAWDSSIYPCISISITPNPCGRMYLAAEVGALAHDVVRAVPELWKISHAPAVIVMATTRVHVVYNEKIVKKMDLSIHAFVRPTGVVLDPPLRWGIACKEPIAKNDT